MLRPTPPAARPTRRASAGVNRMGRITDEGPATLRKLLTEAAWQRVLRSPTIRAFHERMKNGRDDREQENADRHRALSVAGNADDA
ncbi:MAG: transposase [Tepidisphaeraceae bacterium]